MKPVAVVGAVVGGLLGALIWGLVAWKLRVESGYVAWGIGFLVGGGSYFAGGRGLTNGIVSAAICLASIFLGKVLGAKWGLPDQIAELAPDVPRHLVNVPWGEAVRAAVSDLGLMDIVFAVLGVITAFQLGGRVEEEAPTYDPAQMASYQPPAAAPSSQPQSAVPLAQPYGSPAPAAPYGTPVTQPPAPQWVDVPPADATPEPPAPASDAWQPEQVPGPPIDQMPTDEPAPAPSFAAAPPEAVSEPAQPIPEIEPLPVDEPAPPAETPTDEPSGENKPPVD